MDISKEAVELLILLIPGYIAFRIYNVDSVWAEVRQSDVIYGSLVLSALNYGLIESLQSPAVNPFVSAVLGFAATIAAALVFKKWGKGLIHDGLRKLKITNEDNEGSAFSKAFGNASIYVSQLTVYLQNGEAFSCDDTREFLADHFKKQGVYPYYTDRSGNLLMIATERRSSLEKDWEPIGNISGDDGWGTRVVFIPKSNIAHVDARLVSNKQ